MDLLIQIPLVDLRGLVSPPVGRRSKPTWPNGLVGARSGTGEFLGGFGQLRNATAAQSDGWSGRVQYVNARRAVRLPSNFSDYYVSELRSELGWTPPDRRSLRAQVRERFYYGSVVSPRSFVDIRIHVNNMPKPEKWSLIGPILDATTRLPMLVPGNSRPRTLVDVGPSIAQYLREHTTANSFVDRVPTWTIVAGKPLVVLSKGRVSPDEPPKEFETPRVTPQGNPILAHYQRRNGVDCWVLDEPGNERRHRQQLHLSRLHAERTTFQVLVRALAQSSSGAMTPKLDSESPALQAALRECSNYLKRVTAYGEDQAATQEVLQADLSLHAAEWDALRESLSSLPVGLARMAAPVLAVIVEERTEIIMGDKFENIHNSNIVNRSKVVNAFNTLSDDDDQDLKDALRQIVEAVEALDDEEASDVAEELVDAVANKKKPSVIKALWTSLQEAAPVVSTLSGAAATIAGLFA